MCGLIGAITPRQQRIEPRIMAGLSALTHRGPDHQAHEGFTLFGREVWLGHTRLSVIDLDSASNQPMRSEDGRYFLIFNGEIYNYIELRDELRAVGAVFKTRSDTEVLLKAWIHWGEGCLEKFDGMFAFVLVDTIAGKLVCARDAFGIKPFLYCLREGSFFFSSEMPAILRLLPNGFNADLQSAYDYLVYGNYDSDSRTFVDGVRQLEPAHVMTLDIERVSIQSNRRWWEPKVSETSSLSFASAAEAVRENFLLNVRRQLRSDVPLGAALSGGIDSSAVASAIRYLEPDLPIHTFSYIAPDAAISEESWVDIVNKHIGAIPHKVRGNAHEFVSDLDDLVRTQGEPFGSTSIYAQYLVFRMARDNGMVVTLDGQGADELLAGYDGYPGYRVCSYLSEGQGLGALRFARAWSQWPGRTKRSLARKTARAALPEHVYTWLQRLAGRGPAPSWLDVGQCLAAGVRVGQLRALGEPPQRGRWVMHQLRSSVQTHGLPALLRHGDRNSMRFSIESRVPFLSTGICSLLYSLPEKFLITGNGETKSVFRAAMRGIVPDVVLDRRDKIGFATPERLWVKALERKIDAWRGRIDKVPLLNAPQVIQIFDATLSGHQVSDAQVWRLFNFIQWWETGGQQ